MRKTILTGLTTAIAFAAVAGPAYAQAAAPPATPATPAPPLRRRPCRRRCRRSRTSPGPASDGRDDPHQELHREAQPQRRRLHVGILLDRRHDLPNQGVRLSYKSNLKAFNPGTLGPWRHTSGTVGVASGDTILALKFGFKGKTVSQVRESLKITISNATNGAMITNGTAGASAPVAA